MSKFSIICATYNAASTIDGLLKSIQSQTFQYFELLIIDGGSTDNTLDIIGKYHFPAIRVISEKDEGIYDAMNKGVEIATGDWLYFIGADDLLHNPNVLLKVSGCTEMNPGADIIMGKVVMGLKEDVVFVPRFSPKLLIINSLHHQGIFYKRRLFTEFRYNPKYTISADYDLNLKLYLEKKEVYYLDEIISVTGESGLSSQTSYSGYKEEMLIRKTRMRNRVAVLFLNSLTLTRYFIKKYLLRNSPAGHVLHRK